LKHVNILCDQNVGLLSGMAGCKCNTWALWKVRNLSVSGWNCGTIAM